MFIKLLIIIIINITIIWIILVNDNCAYMYILL